MASGDTDISICSDALLLLGANTISSFNEGTTAATVADRLYPALRTAWLSAYPWNFSLKKVQLARSATAPVNEWTYAYPLPSDRVSAPRAVFSSSSAGVAPQNDYEIFAGSLYTDMTTVYIDYQYDPGESSYPEYFVQLLKYILAWHFAMPVTDVESKAGYWQGVAVGAPSENGRGGFFRTAMNIDGMNQSTQAFVDFPLVSVR